MDRPVDSKKQEHLSDWYLKLNPNGVVPTLLHDDAVVIDSSVIMAYLDEVFPEHPLVPKDPVERAKMRKEDGFDKRETESAIDRLRQTVDRMQDLGLEDIWSNHKRVSAWLERSRQRPAYKKTYYRGTRLSEFYDGADYGSAANTAPIATDDEI